MIDKASASWQTIPKSLILVTLLSFIWPQNAEGAEIKAPPPPNSVDEYFNPETMKNLLEHSQPQAVDTVRYDFSSDLQGWDFTIAADSVLEYYPVRNPLGGCDQLWHYIGTNLPFGLTWSTFGGSGSANIQAQFQGFRNDSCDYLWWVKSISNKSAQSFSGADRIEARVYKPSGSTLYAAITYRRPGDVDFRFDDWIGPLPTGTWTTIELQEPSPGTFDDLEAVAVLFGAYNYQASIYVDEVRAINLTAPPTLVSPADGANIEDNLPTFSWTGDGVTYNLQIATDSLFSSPTAYRLISGTSFTLSEPLPNSGGYNDVHYYWRVQANYAGASSAYSDFRRLDISGPHEVPSEFPTIRAAYDAFQTFSGGEILIAPGTYTGAGNCDIGTFGEKPVHITSSGGPNQTIIDCQGDYPGFYYDLYTVGGTRLEGLTIRNAGPGNSAAIVCWTGSPTIRNCIIENSSQYGIYCRSGATPRIENTIIRNNSRYGIYVAAGANPTIVGCDFRNNSGAHIRLVTTTQATVANSYLRDVLVLPDIGSFAVLSYATSLTITGSLISNSNGGGVALQEGDLTLRGCNVVQNAEPFFGGGLEIRTGLENSVEISESFFYGNTAGTGGGIYVLTAGALSISNSTIVDNTTGIYMDVEATLGSMQIDNCIVARSTLGPGLDIISSFGDNLGISCTDIFGNKGGDWIAPFAGLLGVNGNINTDPEFCDPAAGDFYLAESSPCTEANSLCGQMGVYGVACSFNLPPQWLEVRDTTINEDQALSLTVTAEDPDETIPALSTGPLPTNAAFTDNLDGTGTLNFTPDFNQSGEYSILFMADDGEFTDSADAVITVLNVNRPPEFTSAEDDSVAEGETLILDVSATDPDNTIPSLSAEDLPLNGGFEDNSNGTGTFTFSPDFGQQGTYAVRVIASDGELADTASVSVTVLGTNRPPVIEPIADVATEEGESIQLLISASDPDETIPALSAISLPSGSDFTDNGDGTGDFSWTPDFNQSGVYVVTFQASDAIYTFEEEVQITVADVNRAPFWVSAPDAEVQADQTLQLPVEATDLDGTIPLLSALDLPVNAGFTDNGDGTGLLEFSPNFAQIGSHAIRLIASDGALADTTGVTISVTAGAILSVEPTALFPDVDATAASFTISNVGEATLEWEALSGQNWLSVVPQSGSLPATESVEVTVGIDLSAYNAGLYTGQIDIATNAGDEEVTVTAGKSLAVMMPPVLASVYTIDTITVPFNGIIMDEDLLSAVTISSSHGGTYDRLVYRNDEFTYLDILPPAGQGFIQLDSVGIHIDPDLTNEDGVGLQEGDTLRTVLTGAVIWPGDTDLDGVVDERDVLPIAVHLGAQGPPRAVEGTSWLPHDGHAILGGSAWSPYAAIYADADGNGQIVEEDVCAIADNWSSVLTKQNAGNVVLERISNATPWRIYEALVECPESEGRTELIGFLESVLTDDQATLPNTPLLHQNRPNPFNPSTNIEYWLPEPANVSLEVINVEGRVIRQLVSGHRLAGRHSITWDGRDYTGSPVASGVYLYRVVVGDYHSVRKMILLK